MQKFKNFIVGIFYRAVRFAPFLFTQRHRINYESYFYFNQTEDRPLKIHENIKTYSLLDPRLKWRAKAVSTLSSISSKDAKHILEWKKKEEFIRKVDTTVSIVRHSTHNIGSFEVGVGRRGYNHETVHLGGKSKYVISCNVYLIVLDGGHYFLSTYWFLKDEATLALKDIDVSDIPSSFMNYPSCNPFSKNFGCSQFAGRRTEGIERIINNIDDIHEDLKLAETKLFKMLGISNIGNQTTTLDIHVEESESYFIDNKNESDESKNLKANERRLDETLINRFNLFGEMINNPEQKEFLFNAHYLEGSKINTIFIKSQVKNEIDIHGFNNFARREYHPTGSHLTYSFLELMNKEYHSLDRKFSHSLLNSYRNPSGNYQKIYEAFIQTSIIEGQLNSIVDTEGLFYLDDENNYVNDVMDQIKLYLVEIKKIKKISKQRKQLLMS